MNTRPEHCCVRGCKRDAETTWENFKRQQIPVCLYHSRRRLWFYRGWTFDRDE